MERSEFAFLSSIARFIEAKTIVEVGVQVGNMAVHLAKVAQDNGGHYFGFDIWQQHGLKGQFVAQGSKESVTNKLLVAGLSPYVFTLTQTDTLGKRDVFVQQLNELCPSIDFAFIDACHSYHGIANDFFAVYPQLSANGVIAFHDTARIDGCREFIFDLRTKYNDGSFDISDFPFGMGQRRCGVTLLTRRMLPLTDLPIDEICGSVSSPAEIERAEVDWLAKEIQNRPMMPRCFNGQIRLDNLGDVSRKKFE